MSSTLYEWLYRLTLLLLLGCFVFWSGSRLGEFVRNDDEGINLMKARMAGQGYLLHRDVWSDQPPIFTLCLALTFDLFGESVSVARSLVVAFACVGLISTAWIARLLGGRVGSLVAVIFLAFSPEFLELSRSVMIGLPAHALAALAMASGLMSLRTKREIWLAAAGVALSVSLLTKPLQPLLVVPLCMIIWFWSRSSEGVGWRWWGRKLLLLGCAVIVPLVVVLSLFGGPLLVQQVVGTHLERQQAEPFGLDRVVPHIVAHVYSGGLLHWTGVVVGLYGLVLAWRQRDGEGMVVSAWFLCGLAAVCGETRLRTRYLFLLFFPLAGLLSMGLQDVIRSVRRAWTGPRRWVSLAMGAVAIVCLVAGTAAKVRSALAETCCRRHPADEQAASMLRTVVAPGGYVITDDGILPFHAGLFIPPELTVISGRRLGTGQLTAETLVRISQAYEPGAIILWDKRLMAVPEYVDWVKEHYCLARAWSSSQQIYTPCEMLQPCNGCLVQVGDYFDITDWSLSTPGVSDRVVAPGESIALGVRWQIVQPPDAEYHVFCHLGEEALVAQWDGRPRWDEYSIERSQRGEEVVDSYALEVRADAPQGRYPLWVGMYDWATKDRLPVMDAQGHYVGSAALLTHVRVGRTEFELPPISQRQEARLGDGVHLLGYDLTSEEAEAGGMVDLTLYWQCVEEMDISYTVFVHIIDSEGKIVGQWDSIPQRGGLPTTAWVTGEVVVDAYEVPVAQEAGVGSHTLVVGMYDGGTGQRLVARSGEGDRLPGDRVLLGDIRLSELSEG